MSLLCCLLRDPSSAVVAGAMEAIARACSPRVEPHGDAAVLFDASGLLRVLGPPAEIAGAVMRLAVERGVTIRVALAGTRDAAWLLAHARPGATIVAPGEDAAALSPLGIEWLGTLPEERALGTRHSALEERALGAGHSALEEPALGSRRSALEKRTSGARRSARSRNYRLAPGPGDRELQAPSAERPAPGRRSPMPSAECPVPAFLATLQRWGIRTLGEFARLPRADLHARFGHAGVRWHQAASGEETTPLVPAGDAPRFVDRLELEWPIEGLEPLSFVLARLTDVLSAALERADRGAVTVLTRLGLVTRRVHERALHLPAPMRDARVLRTLILLDLESHPPDAAIDVVEVELGVTPGRIVQGSLLARALPSPEDVATLVARLGALMGESRVGAPVLLDTHDERAVAMREFRVPALERSSFLPSALCPLTFRRFRLPVAAQVTVERGAPIRVMPAARGLAGGRVVMSAGPWRTSGRWWALDRSGWDRDEWDVEMAGGAVYRLARDRATGRWEVEGEID